MYEEKWVEFVSDWLWKDQQLKRKERRNLSNKKWHKITEKLLPNGTIVLLKGRNKPLIIDGKKMDTEVITPCILYQTTY